MAPNQRTKKIIEKNRELKKTKPKEDPEPVASNIEFKDNLVYVTHPLDSRIPKFVRMKSEVVGEEKVSVYKLTWYWLICWSLN